MPEGPRIIAITNDPIDVSNSYFIDTLIISDVKQALGQLIEATRGKSAARGVSPIASEIAEVKRRFLAKWADRLESHAEPISPYRVISELLKILDRRKTCLTHDSGNPRDQIVPFFESLTPLGYIGWGKSTPLGAGLGLIMGAKLARPDWHCINIMGDAAIGMVGMDIETAVRNQIGAITIVLNNGLMAGYTYWQPIATERYQIQYLGGAYADLARSLGAHGERVERIADIRPAYERAIRQSQEGRPSLIEIATREEPILSVPESHG